MTFEEVTEKLSLALELFDDCGTLYREAPDTIKRMMNQSFPKSNFFTHEISNKELLVALSELDSKSLRRAVQYKERHPDRLRYTEPCDESEYDPDISDSSCGHETTITEYRQKQSSLTEAEIKQAIIRYGFGASTYELAAEYGVHRTTINQQGTEECRYRCHSRYG